MILNYDTSDIRGNLMIIVNVYSIYIITTWKQSTKIKIRLKMGLGWNQTSNSILAIMSG